MKKPIVDTSAFEDLRSQKLCVTKIEYICAWAVWMAVLIFVGVQLWSEYSTPAGLALGRIVILGVMALGYISVSAIPMVSLCHSSMAAKSWRCLWNNLRRLKPIGMKWWPNVNFVCWICITRSSLPRMKFRMRGAKRLTTS